MFQYLMSLIRLNFPRDEKGQDLSEYAMLIGVIALVVLFAVTELGTNLSTVFQNIATEVGTWFGGGGS
jgi:pilus assembly protein Flp/PilA